MSLKETGDKLLHYIRLLWWSNRIPTPYSWWRDDEQKKVDVVKCCCFCGWSDNDTDILRQLSGGYLRSLRWPTRHSELLYNYLHVPHRNSREEHV